MNNQINKSGVIWNMLGSMCNALSSVLLLMMVNRANNAIDGGIFSIGFATAQLMETIGLYEVRSFQVTDANDKYSFSEYFTFRMICTVIALAASLIYISINMDDMNKMIVAFILCLYKLLDAVSDVFQGYFQKIDRLDMAGKSLAYRVIASTIAFALIIYTNHSLLIACISMVLLSMVCVLFYDYKNTKRMLEFHFVNRFGKIRQLAIDCLPLFLGSFMLMYIINAPKYAIDTYLSDEIQSCFSILFMPASVINLLSLFAFRPVQTRLAVQWNTNKFAEFKHTIVTQIAMITAVTLCAVIGGYFLGIPVLSFIYGVDLSGNELALVIILIGGGCNALMTILYYILTILRKQKMILFGYSIVWVLSLFMIPLFVKQYMLMGATVGYVIEMLVLVVILCLLLIKAVKEKRNLSYAE